MYSDLSSMAFKRVPALQFYNTVGNTLEGLKRPYINICFDSNLTCFMLLDCRFICEGLS